MGGGGSWEDLPRLGDSGDVWALQVEAGQVWSSLVKSGLVWVCLGEWGESGRLDKVSQAWTGLA